MNAPTAFSILAHAALESVGKNERCAVFGALVVVAEGMGLTREHAVALEAVDAIQASDAKQMSFEELIRQQLAAEGAK